MTAKPLMKRVGDRKLILASSSPRRLELLRSTGLAFEVVVSDADEQILPGETPQAMVQRLALLKAERVAKSHPEAWVIGADTTVYVHKRILGKPRDDAEAREMLGIIQGRTHSVWGAFAIMSLEQGLSHVEAHLSRVEMAPMDTQLISRYVETGEPMDKAGSYAIQGYGTHLVSRVEGSYTNVVGLNLAALVQAMKRLGLIEVADA